MPKNKKMKLKQIKKAVDQGKKVSWMSDIYQVEFWECQGYVVRCILNDSTIGLTHQDKVTLNGNESEFYIQTN